MGKMTLVQLNQLLAHVLDEMGHQGLTVITKDDDEFRPWLPESYWARKAAEGKRLAEFNEYLARKAVRMAEDDYLAEQASVADLLEEGVVPLKGDDDRMRHWAERRMKDVAGGKYLAPTDEQQPVYAFRCYQCGRPITHYQGDWVDHAFRSRCDLALLDQTMIDSEDYWTDHHPMPVHGEEQDEW